MGDDGPQAARARRNRIAGRYEAGELIQSIADDEGVCVKTVRNIARRAGIPRRHRCLDAKRAPVLAAYQSGESILEIATRFELHTSQVWRMAHAAGLPPRSGWQRKYPIDEHAFASPDPIGWWLVGLLAADGCVFAAEHRISLAQRFSDKDVLEAFLLYVGCPRPLTVIEQRRGWSNGVYAEARVFSKAMCADLARHGVIPRKSRILKLSSEAAAEPAVWLGLLDGDGSVSATVNHGRERIDFVGARPVIEQCVAFWADRLGNGQRGRPAIATIDGQLTRMSLYGRRAARAAATMLEATPVSLRRKREILAQIASSA